MTYSLGKAESGVLDVAASEATARWFLITPDLERVLRGIPAISMLVGGELGAQYMGISPSGTHVYTKSATGGGSSSGSTKISIPAGAQVISYAEVLSALAPVAQRTSAPAGTNSKFPLYIGLGIGGLALVAGGIYLMTRKPAPLAKNRRGARRVKRNSSFGPARDSAAARARAAFARGDGAAANRALAELRAIDIGLMPRAMKRNDRRWEAEKFAQSQRRRPSRTREEQAIDWYLSLIDPGATYDDHVAAMALTAERYPDVDLKRAMRRLARNPSYAIPERQAYPITTAKDAYHATQRLKQGRVRNEADAKRIVSAIKRRHPEIWRDYLAGYPVSKIIASKRKGLAARHRS